MTDESKNKPETMSKSDKYGGFNVPSKSDRKYKSTPWGHHVYQMIKEANPELLKRDDVREAYNNLIACLFKYEGQLVSWCPDKYNKYRVGIKLVPNELYDLQTIPARFTNEYDTHRDPKLKQQIKAQSLEIVNTYSVLYELIKRDVVPYIEMKQYEIDKIQWMNACKYNIEKLESKILRWEDCIKEAQDRILEYSQKILYMNEPPVLTKFE